MVESPTVVDRDTLTIDELAQRMRISHTVIYELAKRNELPIPVIKVGRQYRFSRRAFERVLNAEHGIPCDSSLSQDSKRSIG